MIIAARLLMALPLIVASWTTGSATRTHHASGGAAPECGASIRTHHASGGTEPATSTNSAPARTDLHPSLQLGLGSDGTAPQVEQKPSLPPDRPGGPATQLPRFTWVDIYADSGDVPLAAYQLELRATSGDFKIVGIEGGEHPAFATPPYYDPAALQNHRVILAALSTDDALPTGRTRVARVHVMIQGPPPTYAATLTVAATASGDEIPVELELQSGDQP